MQGTIVMLMALSGLGCHHKDCNDCYAAPACYSAPVMSGCYNSCYDIGYIAPAPACYASACYGMDSCYGGCYSGFDSCYGGGCYSVSGCYGGGCYSGGHGHGHKRGGGLFGFFKRHRGNRCAPAVTSCYSGGCYGGGCYSSCYATPVFGSYTTAYAEGQIVSSQMPVVPTKQIWTSPQVPTKQILTSPQVPSKQGWEAPQPQTNGTGSAAPATAPNATPEPNTPPPANDGITPPPADVPSIPGDLPGVPGDLNTPPPPAPDAGAASSLRPGF